MQPDNLPAPTLTPLALLDKAIGNGVSPEQLGKLIELAETWRQARAREAFLAAKNAVQAAIKPVAKTMRNNHTDSMYAALENVIGMIEPIYTKHGFSVSFSQGEPSRPELIRFVMDIGHRDGHAEQKFGEYPRDGEGAKGGRSMNGLQGVVSSGTYMQRDMLRLYWNIPIAGADKDGNGHDDSNDPCTPQELNDLNELMKQREEVTGRKVNVERWLAVLGATDAFNLTQAQRRKATDLFNQDIAAAKAKEGAA